MLCKLLFDELKKEYAKNGATPAALIVSAVKFKEGMQEEVLKYQ